MSIQNAEGWVARYGGPEMATNFPSSLPVEMWVQSPDGYVYGMVLIKGRIKPAELTGFQGYERASTSAPPSRRPLMGQDLMMKLASYKGKRAQSLTWEQREELWMSELEFRRQQLLNHLLAADFSHRTFSFGTALVDEAADLTNAWKTMKQERQNVAKTLDKAAEGASA